MDEETRTADSLRWLQSTSGQPAESGRYPAPQKTTVRTPLHAGSANCGITMAFGPVEVKRVGLQPSMRAHDALEIGPETVTL